jgi:hypothetical protein
MRYRTTKRPTVLVGERPAQPLKVPRETKNVTVNIAKLAVRTSHTDNGVPSSYS